MNPCAHSPRLLGRFAATTILVLRALGGLPLPAQSPGGRGGPAQPATPPRILIGPVVAVSRANSSRAHDEIEIAADPMDANRLIACSKIRRDERSLLSSRPFNTIVYSSFDGGASWQPTYE